jgi:MFS transporter, ACS family, hexuronate transporter
MKQPVFTIPGLRWIIVTLLFLATIICYIDRLTISILAPVIKSDLSLNNFQYAGISTWFLISYSVMQAFFGRIYDRFGTRRSFTAAISVWSVAAALHAFARSIVGFSIFRFILGIGEAGNWPGVAKVIAIWFPVKQRALAMSVVNCGAALGSVIAPPLIIWLSLTYGWKAAFLATGSLGFLWVIIWLLIYHDPAKHPLVSQKELNFINSDIQVNETAATISAPEQKAGLRELLKIRKVWGIIIARFFGDPIWWLYLVWLPSYLFEEKGFNLREIGQFAWLPFLVSGIGSLAGGWFSGFLISRGWSVSRARYTAIITGTIFLPAGILAIYTSNAMVALLFISLVLFGFQFWVNNVQTLPSDIFPKKVVASVAGLAQSGAGIGAVIFTLSIGWIVDHFSYFPVFIAAGLFGPLATGSLILITRSIKKINI